MVDMLDLLLVVILAMKLDVIWVAWKFETWDKLMAFV